MKLVDIRQRMADIIGSGASGLTDSVDPYLNVAHQFIVPEKLGIRSQLQRFDFTITEATDVYNLDFVAWAVYNATRVKDPSQLIAVHEPMMDVDRDVPLAFYTDPAAFWSRFGEVDATDSAGRPIGVLVEDKRATFRPKPDTSYALRFYGLLAPKPLESDGVMPDSRALLVAAEAAVLWSAAFGKSDTMQRAAALADRLLPAVRLPFHAGSTSPVSSSRDWSLG